MDSQICLSLSVARVSSIRLCWMFTSLNTWCLDLRLMFRTSLTLWDQNAHAEFQSHNMQYYLINCMCNPVSIVISTCQILAVWDIPLCITFCISEYMVLSIYDIVCKLEHRIHHVPNLSGDIWTALLLMAWLSITCVCIQQLWLYMSKCVYPMPRTIATDSVIFQCMSTV